MFPQTTKDESLSTPLRPTRRLLRLVWLEEGCTRFFSLYRSIPCRCTFQQQDLRGELSHIHRRGFWIAQLIQPMGDGSDSMDISIMFWRNGRGKKPSRTIRCCIYSVFFILKKKIYFYINESSRCALAKQEFFKVFLYSLWIFFFSFSLGE